MSAAAPIIRIAAKGDGVTEDGRHVSMAVPGDSVRIDGSVVPGPHHVDPPCPHFGTCGGCQLQHADDTALAQFVSERVIFAAHSQGLEPAKVAPPHLSPPHSRRRATLHARRVGNRVVIGFREPRGHRIVDLAACPVLEPELFGLVEPMRRLLDRWPSKLTADIALTRADQGIAAEIKGVAASNLDQTEALLAFAQEQSLARLAVDDGYGAEAVWEPEPVTVTLGGVPVALPFGAFLQPTSDGEAALVQAACDWVGEGQQIADLFAGLGTFAFALASQERKIVAVEADRAAHLACQQATRSARLPVLAQHRDLFRNPLEKRELDAFDTVLLDPPRAGARAQVDMLAQSDVRRVIYISCNPQSWSRDAKRLAEAGFRLQELRPVGQFRWSTHVELASLLVR